MTCDLLKYGTGAQLPRPADSLQSLALIMSQGSANGTVQPQGLVPVSANLDLAVGHPVNNGGPLRVAEKQWSSGRCVANGQRKQTLSSITPCEAILPA